MPCFSNNDRVIEAHVIGTGKFEEVHFRNFQDCHYVLQQNATENYN